MSDRNTQVFDSAIEATKFIKTRADDIEKVVIHTTDVQITRKSMPTGETYHGVGMVIHLVDGGKYLISREAAEIMLNDGILARLRIRIELARV